MDRYNTLADIGAYELQAPEDASDIGGGGGGCDGGFGAMGAILAAALYLTKFTGKGRKNRENDD
ncbi:MAG: hypothetical protein LBS53_05665 [Synergistaceae bacterium]|nr:hypothetical protein [Synergistaceae bacterium]